LVSVSTDPDALVDKRQHLRLFGALASHLP
jgi:hypothetical protein